MNLKLFPFAAFATLVGCTTPGQYASQPRVISYEEASAFERSLLARESTTPEVPKRLYIQPINKKEPCKLPTSQDQIDRPNFHAYWDGECKNGYAFGLGRDIAISDTHHVEEITIFDGSGDNWPRPLVGYDYVNNKTLYAVHGSQFPAITVLIEEMDNSVSGFNVYHTLSVVDESSKALVLQTSAFHPQRTYLNTRIDGSIAYRFMDNSAAPLVNQNAATFSVDIVDLKSNMTGGAAIVRYANGTVQQFKVDNGKTEHISLPTAYTNHLQAKYQEVLDATSRANVSLQQAQQIEREYLFKACNGKSSINGLDNAVYTKICTWRDQFKEPYSIASANYQKQLDSMKQQAATAEQQRQIQQQISLQQQILQQQLNQQAWNEVNQASQQLQQSSQQIMQSVNSWQAPQVQPITPLGGNKVVCHTIGRITTCR
jgi:hypothetical protein